ncbi:Xylanase inhibitor, C-terminal [Sesbania bispinosa]|nr:Xylanase inhibitor, C-terminal [Sesbania bispinosa]
MVLKVSFILVLLVICSCVVKAISGNHNNLNKNGSSLAAIKFPDHPSFNVVSSSDDTGCSFSNSEKFGHSEATMTSAKRLMLMVVKVKKRKKNQNTISRLQKAQEKSKQSYKPVVAPAASPEYFSGGYSSQLVATLESGVTLGSGEYFMDVFVGTPPKHFSLILDTGSDLNWIQCVPCIACFEQSGPYYDPKDSSSFKNISCHDPRCQLVSSPDPPKPCKAENQTCPYFYWYGDSSNTTGDFAVETFTVNLTTPTDKSVMVDGEVVKIPEETWHLSAEGAGGTIIDSGTTLTYFADPAYEMIKEAFMKKIKGYALVEGLPPLKPCYNVSGIEKMELPDFGILFADGAVWNFPVENYFIQIDPDVVCLAILGTPRSALSIIGNYQQQNFHILYDMKKSRLGYAPMKCADV